MKNSGYKVYGADGCQITLDAANAIEQEIAGIDYFMDVQTCGDQEARADGRIESIPDSVLDAYVDAVYAQRVTDADCSVPPARNQSSSSIWKSMKTIRSGQNEPMPRCGQPVRSFCNSKIWPAALAAGQSAYSVQ